MIVMIVTYQTQSSFLYTYYFIHTWAAKRCQHLSEWVHPCSFLKADWVSHSPRDADHRLTQTLINHGLNNIRHSIMANRHTSTTFLHFTLNMKTIDNCKHIYMLSSNFHTTELKGPAGLAFFCRAIILVQVAELILLSTRLTFRWTISLRWIYFVRHLPWPKKLLHFFLSLNFPWALTLKNDWHADCNFLAMKILQRNKLIRVWRPL
jgi:hypothetical protein